jgi:transposase
MAFGYIPICREALMAQFYAGLDVSDAETTLCVIDATGAIVHEGTVASTPLAIARALKPYGKMLEKAGLEAGVLSPWLPYELSRRGVPIVYLDPRAARAALKAQRNKTDQNDARGLAQLLRAGWYGKAHIRSLESMRTRLMLIYRGVLKRKALDIEGCLRASLKTFGTRIAKTKDGIVLKHNGRAADHTVGRLAQNLLRARQALLGEAEKLDALVVRTARADPVCRRLMTVPGVGPITALTYKGVIDDPTRFRSSRSVGAYLGLTPRRTQSGQSDYSGHISKIGDQMARTALYEAAFVLLVVSKSKCPLRLWGLKLREQKGTRPAVIACARKLSVILHRMWVTETDFDPSPAKAHSKDLRTTTSSGASPLRRSRQHLN